MALNRSTTRMVFWTAFGICILPFVLFFVAYVETNVIRTSYVKDFFRWIGWHEMILKLFQ